MESQVLILGPQSEFSNRMRMLCSGIIVAKRLKRNPMYYWPGEQGTNSKDSDSGGTLNEQEWNNFFVPHGGFPLAVPGDWPVDFSISEWPEGHYWYAKQSAAHKAWRRTPDCVCHENADVLAERNDSVILVESSREMRLSNYTIKEWRQLMTSTYQEYFKPVPKYLDKVANVPMFDIGIFVQRGEFLHYFPEEGHSQEKMINWLTVMFANDQGKSIVLFSDDNQLRGELCAHLRTMGIDCPVIEWEISHSWETGFLEFLTLATRVSTRVYGTSKSTFGEQAAIYGGLEFVPIDPNERFIRKAQRALEIRKYLANTKTEDYVTIAILVKDKAHLLPLFLQLIENQTYPSSKIKLYIRTNNNRDHTVEMLTKWIEKVRDRYSEIYFDSSDVVEPVQEYAPHEWNSMRFSVLGRIRKESVEWAREKGTHYFVVDCDNFIIPETIEALINTGLPVVGPLLRRLDDPSSMYANFHLSTDDNGYFANSRQYTEIFYRVFKGLIEVDVIHCTYLIRWEFLDKVEYLDDSSRHEYVIFSDVLRKAGIPQYLDNRIDYGSLTFCDTADQFEKYSISILDFI